LPVQKVALVSYDKNLKNFKFNEVRGSDVKENSRVEDVNSILSNNKIYKNFNSLADNPQEISSFTLILPIIFEEELKWFLALGKKNDESDYSKKDVKAFEKLTERIKLSLKFILAYEDIVGQKYLKELSKKDKLIKEKNLQIKELKELLKPR
jgi:ATP-dependent Zn protease